MNSQTNTEIARRETTVAESESRSNLKFAARVGLCILSHSPGRDIKEIYKNIIAGLNGDSRIANLVADDPNKIRFRQGTVPVSGISDDDDRFELPINPDRHIHYLRFNPPVRMHIRTPRRVQASGDDSRNVPSDEYWAVWDGVTLAVAWRYEDSDRPFGRLGGNVVLDMLDKSAEAAHAMAEAIPCGPNCDYPFAHADITLRPALENAQNDVEFIRRGEYDMDAYIPMMSDVQSAVSQLFAAVNFQGRCLAEMRSQSRTMLDLAERAREDLGDLLMIYYNNVTSTFSFKLNGLRRWLRRIRWGASANKLIASLWLAIATIEARKLDLANTKFIYENATSKNGLNLVFEFEYAQDMNLVDHIDVTSFKEAVDHASGRLNTRAMVVATATAAIVGALAGAIVSGIITVFA